MLSTLQRMYPLPSGWSSLEQFTETVVVGESRIELCGFSVSGPTGDCVIGSAASSDGAAQCTARSYFEMLERVSV
ncbi:MAG TPA: hypothetical protein VNZ26_20570, partial [Vicinamibacterales bacterium]|nr:hypothetical protein [Vicinamibacterales bacterium]